MHKAQAHDAAAALLEELYLGVGGEGAERSARERLGTLAAEARSGGTPLDDHFRGPWKVRDAPAAVYRGEFELPVDAPGAARELAALLNWCEVPEPGSQS